MSYEITNEQLKEHFLDALADAEALVKATADMSGDGLAQVRTKARESVRLAKARLAEAQDVVVQTARGAAGTTDAYVRESPWEAIGIAAGVGVLVGVLLARR
jgi:ElaB/YqjD/DUF883 family membrane-anchored ribosome-binding protein